MRTQRSLIIALAVTASAVGLLLAFQNCGQGLSSASSSINGYSTGSAFPFVTKANYFGYMSCDQMQSTYDRNQYFTFRVQANAGHAGVQTSPSFQAFASKSGFNLANQAATITESPYAGATVQLSIRSASNQSIYSFASGTAADSAGEPLGWGSLTTSANLFSILSNGANGTRALQGHSLNMQVSGNADDLGAHNSGNSSTTGLIPQIANASQLLYLGYYSNSFNSGSSLLNPAMSVPSGNGSALIYGSLMQPSFAKPYINASTQTPMAGHGYFSLGSLAEFDGSTSPYTQIPGWVCQKYANQFMILPNSDAPATRAGCLTPAAAAATTYSDAESIRRFAAANALLNGGVANSRWIIDATHNCIFPVQSGSMACYDNGSGGMAGPFIANLTESCGGAGEGLCPHYFSFCSAAR